MIYFSQICFGILLMISESPGSLIAIVHILWYFPHAVPNSTLLPLQMDTSFGQHGVILCFSFPQSEQLQVRMTGFTLPCLIFRACMYPSMYFPLFIRSWNLELIWSLELIDLGNFFVFFVTTTFLPQVQDGAQPRATSKMAGEPVKIFWMCKFISFTNLGKFLATVSLNTFFYPILPPLFFWISTYRYIVLELLILSHRSLRVCSSPYLNHFYFPPLFRLK